MFAKIEQKRNDMMINALRNGTLSERIVDAAYAKMNEIAINRMLKNR